MNKFVGVLVLGSALALSACGGDSDSSGSYGSSEPVQFQGLSNCAISNNTITVNELGRGCLVKKSNINNGKKFSLSCRISRDVANFNIGYTNDGDGKEVKRDIESNPNGKYEYICKPLNGSLNNSFPNTGLTS